MIEVRSLLFSSLRAGLIASRSQRMPLATRIGMRLLYHGVGRGKLLRSRKVEKVRRLRLLPLDLSFSRVRSNWGD